jgi:hypothetical protein
MPQTFHLRSIQVRHSTIHPFIADKETPVTEFLRRTDMANWFRWWGPGLHEWLYLPISDRQTGDLTTLEVCEVKFY